MSDLSSLERDIEQTRERLAGNIDQLVHRISPKTIVKREVSSVRAYFVAPDGSPRTENITKAAVIAGGVVALFVVVRRVVR